jgi:uncharacterized protein YjiS (DUF1127 family)
MTHVTPAHFATSFKFPVLIENIERSWTRAMGALTAAIVNIEVMVDRARQRRQLLSMDHSALGDIGLSSADANGEGSKHFWQA